MPRRNIWQIDMGDSTWSVACMGCRRPLYRGPQRRAARIAARHCCLGPRRRRADRLVGGAIPDPPSDGRAAHPNPKGAFLWRTPEPSR